jgi:hypothetical protein
LYNADGKSLLEYVKAQCPKPRDRGVIVGSYIKDVELMQDLKHYPHIR